MTKLERVNKFIFSKRNQKLKFSKVCEMASNKYGLAFIYTENPLTAGVNGWTRNDLRFLADVFYKCGKGSRRGGQLFFSSDFFLKS